MAGLSVYVRDTVRGHTQPNRVTWLLWAVAPLIGFAAEIGEGVGVIAVTTLTCSVGFRAARGAGRLVRQPPRLRLRLTPFDLACGALSVLALIAWQVTGSGNVAILFSVLADLLAAAPTLRKAYTSPHTETATVPVQRE